MKTKAFTTLFSLAFAAFFTLSCSIEQSPAPTVILTEVGEEDSQVAVKGEEMHLEAEINAPGIIQQIELVIIQQEGSGLNRYGFTASYTSGKYIGVKNAEFHEHIDIPEKAPNGKYDLVLTVIDMLEQTTTAHATIRIVD